MIDIKTINRCFAEILLETKIVRQRACQANFNYIGNYWEDFRLQKEIEKLKQIIKENN